MRTSILNFKFILTTVLYISINAGCISLNPNDTHSDYQKYSNANWGIKFDYPSTMEYQEKTDSRIENNLQLAYIIVQFLDRKETTQIYLEIIEDPSLTNRPDWYPPNESQLKIDATMDIGNLDTDNNVENKNSVSEAIDSAKLINIFGYPSIQYRCFLNDDKYGYIYIQGARIITPIKGISLLTIGGLSKSGALHDTVKPDRVDEIWNNLLSTIVIE